MSGIRIGGKAFVLFCSPPFTVNELSGDWNVFRSCEGDAAGTPVYITDHIPFTEIEATHNPVLSPDGTKIAFIGMNPSGYGDLYVVSSTPGSTPTLLDEGVDTWLMNPMWSPDSSTIVFTRGNAAGNVYGGTVESIPAAGGTPTVLYTPASGYRAYRPSYNFDGSRIAFVLDEFGGAGTDDDLYIMDADGSNATPVDTVTYRLDGSQFGWGNLGDYLAYEDGTSGGVDVFTINGDGTGKTLISVGDTSGAGNRVSKFCWLPDDSGVVITSNQGLGYWSLYECDPAGGGATVLNASEGAMNQGWMKQAFVYNGRIWFIRSASGNNDGKLGSTALDGTDYTLNLDLELGAVGDQFYGGSGFEWQ